MPDLSSRLVKDAMLIMLNDFLYLFNLSIQQGHVPALWKVATVIPFPKVKNSTSATELRPVSLVPLPDKILEKFIHTNLMTYLNTNDILFDKQYGFRPGLSTTDAIATLIDDIGLALNSGRLTIATFIDFSKAFYTLDHGLLLERINELHPSNNTFRSFDSYWTNRKQMALTNDVYSSQMPIVTGVPQGSILGPLRFILYVNRLTSTTKSAKMVMFAVDTVVYDTLAKVPSNSELTIYQEDLDNISRWVLTIN